MDEIYSSSHQPASSFFLKDLLLHSWWVIVFSSLCAAIYFQSMHNWRANRAELLNRYHEMQKEKVMTIQEQEELALRLQSESDPAWIETVLMKELGVVPEGWIKVHFKS